MIHGGNEGTTAATKEPRRQRRSNHGGDEGTTSAMKEQWG